MNSTTQVDSHNLSSIVMNSPWLINGIIISIGILVLLVVLIKWFNSGERKKVDRHIGEKPKTTEATPINFEDLPDDIRETLIRYEDSSTK